MTNQPADAHRPCRFGGAHQHGRTRAARAAGIRGRQVLAAGAGAEWKLGDASSVAIDAQDNVYVLASAAHAQARRDRRQRPRRPSWCSIRTATSSRAGAAKARATNGRSASTGIHIDPKGFVWIGGNQCPTSGLAGLKPVGRRCAAQVHHRRQVRAADRQEQPEQGRRRHREPAPRSRRVGLCAHERSIRRRRLRQSSRHRV